MRLLSIGFGNFVSPEHIISIVSPDSAPIKRMIQDIREKGYLIDASFGRSTKSVIITDSGHAVLSSLSPDQLQLRLNDNMED